MSPWTTAAWGDDIPGVGGRAQVPAEKPSAEKLALPKVKKLVYVYLVRYAEEQQDLALLSISTFQRGLKVRGLSFPPRAWVSLALSEEQAQGEAMSMGAGPFYLPKVGRVTVRKGQPDPQRVEARFRRS